MTFLWVTVTRFSDLLWLVSCWARKRVSEYFVSLLETNVCLFLMQIPSSKKRYMIAFPWTFIFSVVSASCPQGWLDWEYRVLYLSAITLTCNPELLIRSTCYDMPGLCSHWSSSKVWVVLSCVVFTPVCFISPACISLSVVVWNDPSGCINNYACKRISTNHTSCGSISYLNDRSIQSILAKSDVVAFTVSTSALAFV